MSEEEIIRKRFHLILTACWPGYFPSELLTIIIGYAIEYPHIWCDQHAVGPRIIENFVTNSSADCWYRITSKRTVMEGPQRWRIKTNFEIDQHGWIAFGVSGAQSSVVALVNTGGKDHWTDSSTENDFLMRTSIAPAFRKQSEIILLTNRTQGFLPSTQLAAVTTETTAFIQFDPRTKTLVVEQLIDDKPVRIRWPLETDITCFRPCLVISGRVCAAILPWY